MDADIAAQRFAALGNPSRLHIIRLLVQAGADGLNIGAIGAHTGIPASTLAHHVRQLVAAGLIRQERRGRETCTIAAYDTLDALHGYLFTACCQGAPHAEAKPALEGAER